MTTDNIQTCFGEVKKELMGSHDSGYVWIEKGDGNVELFVEFFHLLSDETVTTLKSTALPAYLTIPSLRMSRLEGVNA